jgi:hypothetical protein
VKVAAPGTISSGITEGFSEYAQRAKAAWARLIRKVPIRFDVWSPRPKKSTATLDGMRFAAQHLQPRAGHEQSRFSHNYPT